MARPGTSTPGDLLLAVVRQRRTTATVSAPPGWNLVRTDAGSARSTLFYKVTTSNEPGTYAFGTGTSVADLAAHILRYSGIDTSSPGSPILASAVKSNTGTKSGSSVVAPSLTPSMPGALYVAFWSAGKSASVSSPTGLTERSETSALMALASADTVLPSTTSSGTRSAALSVSADRRIGQAVLLRPAS